ncbi:hypothetical protein C7447_101394 [Tenacibaculum adriaticum]|uniref:Nicotinic acid mononucleotide adenyltransferase n=1 Tax=Tenacibaculum adriaticum TaxID=413713 RepID=A0A5S5DYZ1_9FLAO|nr:hypothetical protein [Tenacibaculum adriaticum]TYP99789.1 hypothetical protein C7447_101394 [Tenacibaculum adriaticum]
MKTLKLLFLTLITGILLSSCVDRNVISLEEVVSGYDLWYVDYHRTSGNGDVPFLSKAFTVSFLNGRMYANNNIVDIGRTGNGLGILVGEYDTYNGVLETFHDLDGSYRFDVVQLSGNEIRIDDIDQNVSYYLIGYQRNNFDYDKLFYENIEYFLQEYIAWERTGIENGTANPFDEERYLQFTPENDVTFYSSRDPFGTNIDFINWNFVGSYTVYDVNGYSDLKILTLNYDGGDIEEFELSVINDQRIALYHISSQTTYVYSGRGFVQYLKGKSVKDAKSAVRNNGRKRTKIVRKKVDRKVLK